MKSFSSLFLCSANWAGYFPRGDLGWVFMASMTCPINLIYSLNQNLSIPSTLSSFAALICHGSIDGGTNNFTSVFESITGGAK
jgi:hypothetical protein